MNTSDFDPHDDRPFVKDLLEEHARAIADVRRGILSDQATGKPLWDPERYDDLWILRFLLSHKLRVPAATRAALKTIRFRHETKLNEIGDIRHSIRNCGIERKEGQVEAPCYHVFNSACGDHALTVTQPDPDRGLMIYMYFGNIDCEKLAEGMTKEEAMESRIYTNEANYQVLDEVTRRTGRLTKIAQIMDCSNVSLRQVNGKFVKRDGEISKELEDYFPQMISSIYFVNAPGWLNALWSLIRKIAPRRMLEKFDVVPNVASQKVYAPLLRHVSEANLPERFGGKNREWPLPSVSDLLAASKEI